MKNSLLGLLLVFPVCAFAALVELTVVDDRGEPVRGAEAEVAFATYSGKGEKIVRGLTTKDGKFKARGSSNHSTFVTVEKGGHYRSRIEKLKANTDYDLTVVLPRIRNPRPLYHVLRKDDEIPILPSFDTWYGFDMKMADWVAPHGKGEVVDFRARMSRQFTKFYTSERNIQEARRRFPEYTEDDFRRIWGDWELTFDMEFVGQSAGVVESPSFHEYSEMPLPYDAPESGYQRTWNFNYTNRASGEKRDNVGHFVKTRVIYDEEGKTEVSANYAKFISDPWVGTQGEMLFEYYFNPDPNDRNLEYNGNNLAEEK